MGFQELVDKFGLATALVGVIIGLHVYNVRIMIPKLMADAEANRKAHDEAITAQQEECRTERKELLTAYRELAASQQAKHERELAAEREQHDKHIMALIAANVASGKTGST